MSFIVPCRAHPIEKYPARTRQAASIMHMIMNNLDPHVAQFPQELVTYGGNGQVFSNWAQVIHRNHFWCIVCSFHEANIWLLELHYTPGKGVLTLSETETDKK